MRPALSVIFFTVLSGTGLGLLASFAFFDLIGFLVDDVPGLRWPVLGTGMAFVTAGLIASVFHLANPKNAWRGFTQFKQSWLAREAVFAVVLYPVVALYAFLPNAVTALVTLLLALAVLYSTAMIYACLKTIPRWHTGLVPASFLALGLYAGGLLLFVVADAYGAWVGPLVPLIFPLLGIALAVKGAYYARFPTPAAKKHALNAALGQSDKEVRLLDVGHSHGTFLTDEFGFVVARSRARMLRWAFIVLAFVVPAVAIFIGVSSLTTAVIALVAALAGILIERWLFFAEAEHVVRLFHGAPRV